MALPANVSYIRAVFSAMFDAVDTMGEWDEGRWQDLIAAFNTTGRLVFGWPHLESSESDIFGALDDIADTLARTKADIERTTADAERILRELRAEIGMGPEEERRPDEAAADSEKTAHIVSTEIPIDPGNGLEAPEPVIEPEYPAPDLTPAEPVVAVSFPVDAPPLDPPIPKGRQGPRYDREAMFEVLRRNPSINKATKELGISGKAIRDRLDTLEGHGELPDDIVARFARRSASMQVATPLPMDVLEQSPEQVPPTPPEPEPESFDDRRKRMAREAAERTWRQTHPEATA